MHGIAVSLQHKNGIMVRFQSMVWSLQHLVNGTVEECSEENHEDA